MDYMNYLDKWREIMDKLVKWIIYATLDKLSKFDHLSNMVLLYQIVKFIQNG